jgi:DNA helicase-2/ATP-dependent DNA helicase PcrA
VKRYFNQLCLYAHILKERYGRTAERLYVYWTSEEKRANALMEFDYSEEQIDKIGSHFDKIVQKIREKRFGVDKAPNYEKTCRECDFRYYCASNSIIELKKLKYPDRQSN